MNKMVNCLPGNRNPLFDGVELGIGTSSWGDRFRWGYGVNYKIGDVNAAFNAAVSNGITFIDTAETYGQGQSEHILGNLLSRIDLPLKIATKFMPFPWRLTRSDLIRALKKSINRLRIPCIDLYQIHWPLPPVSIEVWMETMADALQRGLIRAVGVSNFDSKQLQTAYQALQKKGILLASNQVEYNLLNRNIEKNGVYDLCHSLGIVIIASSPLAMGVLTGKYSTDSPPPGIRGRHYNSRILRKIEPLISTMKNTAENHPGKNAGQVALNWIIRKGAIPIPGAKNGQQALQNAGASGWYLSAEEIARLDQMSEQTLIN
jgi:aryl-alcohol dehydrogenase-like predicted oxidoreductase